MAIACVLCGLHFCRAVRSLTVVFFAAIAVLLAQLGKQLGVDIQICRAVAKLEGGCELTSCIWQFLATSNHTANGLASSSKA